MPEGKDGSARRVEVVVDGMTKAGGVVPVDEDHDDDDCGEYKTPPAWTTAARVHRCVINRMEFIALMFCEDENYEKKNN